ncbi:RdgB/HAM1 family non-canonical purine NTP pyrophosphatase [Ignicoccus islandicus]|nr:RdgB/HAM1 family non-canonical purine NTP pyrophosphatase [Ignicoccus islandicus]
MKGRKKLYVASTNKHKIDEIKFIIRKILGDEIEIDIAPFNAKVEIQDDDLKKIVLYSASILMAVNDKRPIIVEDSGLFIEALNGFPGPYSNYVYRTLGPKGILKLMDGVPKRNAFFKCVAACICNDDNILVEEGVVKGSIAHEIRGSGGFGFDPIFIPQGYSKTFSELPEQVKNEISHRALAIRALIVSMEKRGYL